jgi:hypothetical protein
MADEVRDLAVPAGALGLWIILEDEIRRGLGPDPRHVAEALRQGIPIVISADLQRYIAGLIPPPKALRGQRALSASGRAIRDRALLERFDALAVEHRDSGGSERNRKDWVFERMARERGCQVSSVKKQYNEARSRIGPRSAAAIPEKN